MTMTVSRTLIGIFLLGQLINARFRRDLGYVSCTIIFLHLLNFYYWNPEFKIEDICLSLSKFKSTMSMMTVRNFIENSRTIITSNFYHHHEFHLTFSILSFMSKGNYLEFRVGSRRFLRGIGIILILTTLCSLCLHYLINQLIIELNPATCTNIIGFSGITFALKVWTIFDWSQRDDIQHVYLFGFWPVTPQIGAWILWLEFIVPLFLSLQDTIIPNIGGVLVGLVYIHLLI